MKESIAKEVTNSSKECRIKSNANLGHSFENFRGKRSDLLEVSIEQDIGGVLESLLLIPRVGRVMKEAYFPLLMALSSSTKPCFSLE